MDEGIGLERKRLGRIAGKCPRDAGKIWKGLSWAPGSRGPELPVKGGPRVPEDELFGNSGRNPGKFPWG